MNGFADRGLDEGDFGSSAALSVVKSFDAFPKTKKTYLTNTRNGGIYTILIGVVCLWLTSSEFWRWMVGHTTHTFSVEKGVAHDLQINLDVVVAMQCGDLHVNVQDASGDRIMAGELLKKDPTKWAGWTDGRGRINAGWGEAENWKAQQNKQYSSIEDVHDTLSAAGRGQKKFSKTPKLRGEADACRIYGSIEGNKVQGDFHITARGHGYQDMGAHIDHSQFNFSHHINELSYGPFFPKLHNPLDSTSATTPHYFYKFQYYMSVVPTIYTDTPHRLESSTAPGPNSKTFNPYAFAPHTIFTNQYAVTEQSHEVGQNMIPGIFMKYDIEPILLTVAEEWGGFLGLVVRCVNVVAGVLVAGGWLVSMLDWAVEGGLFGRRRKEAPGADGLLHGM